MSLTLDELVIESLSVSERLDLIGALWDSITDSGEQSEIPEWHQRELEQRRSAADSDPEAGTPWDEVKARLLKSS